MSARGELCYPRHPENLDVNPEYIPVALDRRNRLRLPQGFRNNGAAAAESPTAVPQRFDVVIIPDWLSEVGPQVVWDRMERGAWTEGMLYPVITFCPGTEWASRHHNADLPRLISHGCARVVIRDEPSRVSLPFRLVKFARVTNPQQLWMRRVGLKWVLYSQGFDKQYCGYSQTPIKDELVEWIPSVDALLGWQLDRLYLMSSYRQIWDYLVYQFLALPHIHEPRAFSLFKEWRGKKNLPRERDKVRV
jgi:hypothetical protein